MPGNAGVGAGDTKGAVAAAGGHMPEPHRAVAASGGEQDTVRGERASLDPAGVAVKCRLQDAVVHAPESYGSVVADGRQQPAVRGECTTRHSLGVADQQGPFNAVC